MKVLILLSLVAACLSQSTYVGRHVTITDGTISVVGEHGREIHMYKSPVDPRKLQVILKTPYGPNRKIEIDETNGIHDVDYNILDGKFFHLFSNLGSGYTQHDVLVHLFHEYEGVVDAMRYDELVRKIHHLVQVGVLHQSVWDILKYFDQHYAALNHLPWVNHEGYYPEGHKYSVQQYGVSPYQGWYKYQHYGYSPEYEHVSPVQRLYQLVQKYKYNQEYYPEEYHYVHYYPGMYEKHQYPYGQYHAYPWMKYSQMNKYSSPYQWQYQSPMEHKESYGYGYHQYPEYYQKHSWYPQQWYSSQKSYAPQQWYSHQNYVNYNSEYVPQQWHSAEHYGSYEHVPLVH